MRIKIGLSNLVYLLINIIIVTPIIFFMDKDCNNYIAIISIIQVIMSVYQLKIRGVNYLSLQIMFIILSTIFHFGQVWLLAIGRNELFNYTNLDLAKDIRIYNEANIFALLIQIIVVFGMLLVNENYNYNKNSTSNIKNKQYEENILVYKIGIVLFFVSVIPNFLYYYSQIRIILSGGVYSGIREAINYGPLMLLKVFYQPAIFMLLIGSKNNIKRARIILMFSIMFEFFCMISGNRAQQLLMIITMLVIYYRVIKKIRITNIILFTLIGYITVVLLYFISKYRNFNIGDINLFWDRLADVIQNNPGVDLLAQLGSNLNVVVLSFTSIPSYNSYNYGLTYLVSFLAIYPNTGGLLGKIPNMYAFLNYLDTQLPLGGSYIAELYFNFGWYGVLFSIFIGFFIGIIGNNIESSIQNERWIKLSVHMIIFLKLLWWVRDYFYCWIFQFSWSLIIIWLLSKIIAKKKAYKKTLFSNNIEVNGVE